jgi:uncharacterized membrane protein
MKIKKIMFFILIIASSFAFSVSCSSGNDTAVDDSTAAVADWKCGTHNGNQLWTGPKGGCYYYNSNNNKTYVDKSECSCSH